MNYALYVKPTWYFKLNCKIFQNSKKKIIEVFDNMNIKTPQTDWLKHNYTKL